MHILSLKRSLFLFLFITAPAIFAQDKPIGSETVIVVKPYTPSVNDAFKIKETPKIEDSVNLERKPVKYSIFSVPVASTFSPVKGQATRVEREKRIKIYNNYLTLGFGTYSSALAEFYSNMEISRSDNFGVFLTHNSSQGGIKGVELDDSFYNTELNLNYNSRNRKSSWNTELGLEHELFHWYGVPDGEFSETVLNDLDPQQNYYSALAGGEFELYDSFFKKARANYRYFGDSYSSAEHNFKAGADFELNIADELISTNVFANILNGNFQENFAGNDEINYTNMIFGISPSLLILRDNLTVNLGASFVFSTDPENSQNSFYIYPQVTASYRLAGEYFIPYAGFEGELQQNSYYSLTRVNPFVSPTLEIIPTDKPIDAYVGAKGKLGNSVSYNLRGSYITEYNKPLFVHNLATVGNREDYAYGNSFDVVYDDVKTFSFFGELNVDVRRNFKLGMNAAVFTYSTENEEEAWNLPDFKASVLADYQITENWFAGANLFFTGERKDREQTIVGGDAFSTPFITTVESFVDLNAKLGYRFNDQLSVFARGNNLLGKSYERWENFQVQGLQVLAGATYKFDW